MVGANANAALVADDLVSIILNRNVVALFVE